VIAGKTLEQSYGLTREDRLPLRFSPGLELGAISKGFFPSGIIKFRYGRDGIVFRVIGTSSQPRSPTPLSNTRPRASVRPKVRAAPLRSRDIEEFDVDFALLGMSFQSVGRMQRSPYLTAGTHLA
jgi:hypothetical protein